MNEQEAAEVLSVLVGLDGRLRPPDDAVAAARPGAWARVLGDVDARFARGWIEDEYATGRQAPVNVGDVLGAWREWQDAQAKAERDVPDDLALLPGGAPEDPGSVEGDREWQAYARRVTEALAAGQPWEAIPKPTRKPLGISRERDLLERRCRFWQYCDCTHTECRDGFLDEEFPFVRDGRTYDGVKRCPRCEDALQMAEVRGVAKPPPGSRRR